jgi:molybdopterin converting factor small subunit
MRVKTIFYGILSEWFGEKETELELPEGATYGRLLEELGLRFGNKMPQILWDHEQNNFSAPVLALGSNGSINSHDDALEENEQVTFMLKVGGG